MTTSTWLGRRRNALLEAAGLLEDLQVDQTKPVDVFDMIRRLGLWLTFVPLDNTLGACLPFGHGGIMITTQRQPAVQRYTAAHEISHWRLDHGHPWFDDEEAILGPTPAERERIAQLFAGYLLMPPTLVHAVADHHGIEPGSEIEPPQAYLAARDMGTSYEAAVRQMGELELISGTDRDRLLAVTPLAAKTTLALGQRPVVGSADVWPIDEHWDGAHLDVSLQDEIVIALPENRTTGYRWMTRADLRARDERPRRTTPPPFTRDQTVASVATEPTTTPWAPGTRNGALTEASSAEEPSLAIVADRFVAARQLRTRRQVEGSRRDLARGQAPVEPPRIGATGRRWLSVQARAEGTWRYELAYAAEHQPFAHPVAAFRVEATIRPTPAVSNARHLLAAAQDDGPDTTPTAS